MGRDEQALSPQYVNKMLLTLELTEKQIEDLLIKSLMYLNDFRICIC